MKFTLPNNRLIDNLEWHGVEGYPSLFYQKYRCNVKSEIIKYESNSILDFNKPNNEKDIGDVYKSYRNIRKKSSGFNVFKLPFEYFNTMCQSEITTS